MLHIILLLLKIIGWILLIILGILILVIFTVLFTAVKYRIAAGAKGTLDSVNGSISFHWLFHLVRGTVRYERGTPSFEVKILWKRMNLDEDDRNEEEFTEEFYKEPKKEKKSSAEHQSLPDPGQQMETLEGPVQKNEKKAETRVNATSADSAGKNKESESAEYSKKNTGNQGTQNQSAEKTGILQKFQSWFQKMKNKILRIWKKFKYTIRGICDKINTLSEKKEQLERFLTDEIHVAAFQKGIRETKRLLRFLKPRKAQMNLRFGFEDPYHTGQVLAAASILYPFAGKYVCLTPDFEQAVLEGDLKIQGRIRAVYFVIVAVRLLLDKNIRLTYQHIRKWTASGA